jgi:Asp/Glu/hydantoin racemase
MQPFTKIGKMDAMNTDNSRADGTQTSLKFWHQSMTELNVLGPYADFLEEHGKKVLRGEAQLSVHGLRAGSYAGRAATPALINAFVFHRVLDQIIDNAIVAEKSGYDAFIIGSFSEPFLREIRSIVRIPVVSILESSMLIGCSLGKKVIPISNAPQVAAMTINAVEKHGLSERVLQAVSLDPAWHEPALAVAIESPDKVIDAFLADARKWIQRGAEVVLPAEGILATVLAANGVVRVDGAPVIDVFAAAWRHAVTMVSLRRICGIEVSEVGTYARGEIELMNLIAERSTTGVF